MRPLIRLVSSKITDALVAIIVFSIVLIMGKAAITYTIDVNREFSYWLDYVSIVPVKKTIFVNEPMEWKTSAIRYKAIDIDWIDTLRCVYDVGNGSTITILPVSTSSQLGLTDKRYIGDPLPAEQMDAKVDKSSGLWEWGGGMPKRTGWCYIRTQIRLRPSPFVEKYFTFKSDEVRVINPNEARALDSIKRKGFELEEGTDK